MQKFQPIQPQPALPKYKGIRPLRIIIEEKKSLGTFILRGIKEDFFSCTCYHMDTGHDLLEGKCDYPYCDCLAFSPLDLEMKIEIRNIDLFKLENKDCGSENYPQFWIEFKKWMEKNKK